MMMNILECDDDIICLYLCLFVCIFMIHTRRTAISALNSGQVVRPDPELPILPVPLE